jgi:hypothetical protein
LTGLATPAISFASRRDLLEEIQKIRTTNVDTVTSFISTDAPQYRYLITKFPKRFRLFTKPTRYIEVISYEKMLDDAQKRNRILFDKLQMPPGKLIG